MIAVVEEVEVLNKPLGIDADKFIERHVAQGFREVSYEDGCEFLSRYNYTADLVGGIRRAYLIGPFNDRMTGLLAFVIGMRYFIKPVTAKV